MRRRINGQVAEWVDARDLGSRSRKRVRVRLSPCPPGFKIMTVKELRDVLSSCNDNDVVVIASDGEGNNYSTVADINTKEYNWSFQDREIGLRELTDALEKQGYGEEDLCDGMPCVIIWPS